MDILKALTAAKKKNLNEQKKQEPESGSIKLGNGKTFYTRKDLRRLESRKQIKRPLISQDEARQNEEKAATAAAAKRARVDEGATGGTSSAISTHAAAPAKGENDGKEDQDLDLDTTELPRLEVRRRLRGMGEPVTLFGESDADRLLRLRKLEKYGQQVQKIELALTGGASTRNVFVDRASGKELDEQNPEDSDHSDEEDDSDDDDDDDDDDDTAAATLSKTTAATLPKTTAAVVPSGETIAKPTHQQRQLSEKETKEKLARKEKKAKLKADSKKVHKYFKGQLKEWEAVLMARPDEVKRSSEGKMKAKQEKQCKDYVRPLFKQCKERTVPPDILFHCTKIVDHCNEMEFVRANDEYIKLAIGSAPWPMGATSVGIHARKGRESIGEGKVSHIMNNELQRKYLQSVKRLITFAQSRSTADPSKCVK